MTSLVLNRLPKHWQLLYFEYGRNVALALVGAICAITFIALHERGSDTVEGHALLAVQQISTEVGNNGSAETLYKVTTPDGETITLRSQSPIIARETGATICAELLRASDGSLRWDATRRAACAG